MMNIISIPSIQKEYQSALLVSVLEGLKGGTSVTFLTNDEPTTYIDLVTEADIKNIKWTSKQNNEKKWELTFEKYFEVESDNVGCCGMCGGEKRQP